MATTGAGGAGWSWGDELVRSGRITQNELDQASQASSDPVAWLLEQGILDEKDVYKRRAFLSGGFFVDLDQIAPVFHANDLSLEQATELSAVPLRRDGDALYVAFRRPEDPIAVERVAALTGCTVVAITAVPSQVDARLAYFQERPDLWPVEPPLHDPAQLLFLTDVITAEQLAAARAANDDDPVRWLLEEGVIGENEFATSRARESGLTYSGPSDGSFHNGAPETVPPEIARKLDILPLFWQDDTLIVALSDPRRWAQIRHAEEIANLKIEPLFILQARDLAEALARED